MRACVLVSVCVWVGVCVLALFGQVRLSEDEWNASGNLITTGGKSKLRVRSTSTLQEEIESYLFTTDNQQ